MRSEGRIRSWKDDKGFGFITPDGGGEDVFVHISAFDARGSAPPRASAWRSILAATARAGAARSG